MSRSKLSWAALFTTATPSQVGRYMHARTHTHTHAHAHTLQCTHTAPRSSPTGALLHVVDSPLPPPPEITIQLMKQALVNARQYQTYIKILMVSLTHLPMCVAPLTRPSPPLPSLPG